MAKPRKVLFLAGDQWRAECLSALGHPIVTTPNLDALAGEGVLFRRHYTQASPCGPARASLLTGLYQMTHRSVRNGTPLDARFTNLAREARAAGLPPTMFGYTDTSADPRGRAADDPALRSFEGVLPDMGVGLQLPTDMMAWRRFLHAEGYPAHDSVWDYFEPADGMPGGPAVYRAEHSPTAFLADQVIDHITRHADDPWLTYVAFLAPHPPLRAAAPWHERVRPGDVPMPHRTPAWQDEMPLHPFHAWRVETMRLRRDWLGRPMEDRRLDEDVIRQIRATYYALIAETDHHIGRVLRALKDTGQWDDTLIVATVDHGEMLGDHWLVGKETVFDPAFHIPCILRDPRRAADAGRGRQVGRFTEAVDLLPTVLDWLERPAPPALNGLSLRPFLEGREPSRWRQAAHYEYDFRDPVDQTAETALGLPSDLCVASVLRGERWKYIHFAGLPPLLFDMVEDPREVRNLANDPAHQGTLLASAQELLSFRMAHADRTLSGHFLTADGVVSRADPRY
ncbi:MAG TPA: alkaline phosphatase family protein [Stellaceae bacterium]|nr:alkaline phosphatase family protein [Stellaceae bacterium]